MKRTGAGAQGWDQYAPFYDWENAQTLARRDVRFWQRLAIAQNGPILELGCGTGRLTVPVARTGAHIVGIDRSLPMLARARRRLRRARLRAALIRGDIRQLPFRRRTRFDLVMAPYGMLQSLTSDRDLCQTLDAVASVLSRGGRFAIDLVPDLPGWAEYDRRVSLSGRRGRGLLRVEGTAGSGLRRLRATTRRRREPSVGRERRTHRGVPGRSGVLRPLVARDRRVLPHLDRRQLGVDRSIHPEDGRRRGGTMGRGRRSPGLENRLLRTPAVWNQREIRNSLSLLLAA